MISEKIGFGITAISSTISSDHKFRTSTFEYGTMYFTNHYVNVGPEFRFRSAEHNIFSLGYTYHTGLKIGLDYVLFGNASLSK
jgi:hypothetical protein